MTIHTRKCWDCGNVAEHSDNVTPDVLCKVCGSQDTRVRIPPETRSRAEVIAEYVEMTLPKLIDDAAYLRLANSESEPLWFEIRDAIISRLFTMEHEQGRLELYAEQVVENCL